MAATNHLCWSSQKNSQDHVGIWNPLQLNFKRSQLVKSHIANPLPCNICVQFLSMSVVLCSLLCDLPCFVFFTSFFTHFSVFTLHNEARPKLAATIPSHDLVTLSCWFSVLTLYSNLQEKFNQQQIIINAIFYMHCKLSFQTKTITLHETWKSFFIVSRTSLSSTTCWSKLHRDSLPCYFPLCSKTNYI